MKLAILHAGDLDTLALGGVDRYIKSLIDYFDDGEITVLGTGKYGKDIKGKVYNREYHGKQYKFIPIALDKRRPLTLYYLIEEIKNLHLFRDYDCIYAQRTELSLPFVFSKEKKKLIQIIHGSNKYTTLNGKKIQAYMRLFFERISIITAEKTLVILNRKEFGVPYYRELYPKYSNKIKYTRNPINPNIYYQKDKMVCRKELGICSDCKIVLYVGRLLDASKRVMLLPEIACQLKNDTDIVFYIVGDGPDRSKIESKIKEYGLTEKIKIVGYIDDTSLISKYYSSADIVINVSLYEGTCTSNLEALACGIPLVATDVGDIREVLDGVHNGALIEPSPNALVVSSAAKSIEKILKFGVSMDNSYEKYYGENVIKDLREEMKL